MAKKPSRSGRPQPGGRVTPKGSQAQEPPRSAPVRPGATPGTTRVDPARGGGHGYAAPHVPTRSGHHRGNR